MRFILSTVLVNYMNDKKILYSKLRFLTCTILANSLVIAGCATTKVNGYAPYSKFLAARDVVSQDCLDINPLDKDYINYRVAASKLLTVMNVDAELYNQTYKTLYKNTRTASKEEKSHWCEKLRYDIVNETKNLEGDYNVALESLEITRKERAEKWANAIEAIAVTMLVVGVGYAMSSSYQTQQYQYIPMSLPSPNINGIHRQQNVNNYLVNTPSGLRQCSVVSNYVRCS